MPNPIEITIGRLRLTDNTEGSKFVELYEALMRGSELPQADQIGILRIAALFLRSDDSVVNKMGYRIVLQHAAVHNDYEPLLDVARTKDYMPIVAAIERIRPSMEGDDTLSDALFSAHRDNFTVLDRDGGKSYRTRGQMELRAFSAMHEDAVVVAPTSYGKSEMLVDKVRDHTDQAVCIIVPTRALIAQTRQLLVQDPFIRASRTRVFTHPDAYTGTPNFIAVLTQERLQRLFQKNPDLSLDLLLIDEAHNLLPSDPRAQLISQVIITAQHRNGSVGMNYFTPFLAGTRSLTHVTQTAETTGKSISEYVKIERIIHANLESRMLRLYDQFLNSFIDLEESIPRDELEAVISLSGQRTLVYVNRPRDAQDLALRLSEQSDAQTSARARIAIAAIGDLIDPAYSLINCIRRGVLFHHGKVPDLLRGYIEELFRDESPDRKTLVTTSTLLEGVNTPADRLIVMTPSKGRGYLNSSSFRNLVGRVGRFKEVFDPARPDLDLLQPQIFLMKSSYAPTNWAVESYMQRVADARRSIADDVQNPLLSESTRLEERAAALEYLENIESGSSGLEAPRVAQTEVGKACFLNGVLDFDIFAAEAELQHRIDLYRESDSQLADVGQVIATICELFLNGIELKEDAELIRVRDNQGARNFYSLFLSWRANNEPYKRMIAHFLRYWSQLGDELVYVGSTWGELTYGDLGFRELYVRMRGKTRPQLINLAVAKVKEEQDFVDFNLVRYIEIMNDLGLVAEDLYNRVKYGTADPHMICLLRNGMSPELARLVRAEYSDHVRILLGSNEVRVSATLPGALVSGGENDILVYEAETMAEHEDTPREGDVTGGSRS